MSKLKRRHATDREIAARAVAFDSLHRRGLKRLQIQELLSISRSEYYRLRARFCRDAER